MKQKNNKKFNLVSSSKRLITRVLDYLLLLVIYALVIFLCIYFIVDWSVISATNNNYNHKLFSGMFLIGNVINLAIWFLYMILLPKYCKGRTLGCLITRSKLYWDDDKSIFARLIKHEGLGTLPMYGIIIIASLISFAFDHPIYFFINIFSIKSINHLSEGLVITSKVMFAILFISCIFVVGVIINDLMNNKTSTYLDDVTNIYMLDLDTNNPKEDVKEKRSNNLPGQIDIDELEV